MCNTVSGGGSTATQAPPATKAPDAPPPKVGGASGGGCGGGGATAFDPSVAGLQDQLASGLRQLQSMGINTGGGPGGKNPGQFAPGALGGGPMSKFQQVEAIQQVVQLVPSVDGASALENLRRMSSARNQRVQQLEQALAADQQASGSYNPVDMQKMQLEKQLAADVERIIQKLTPLAATIDANEAASLVKLVSDANGQGTLDPSQLARVLIQVEGSAANLPASYMASANRAQDFAATIDQRLNALSNQVAANANQTGSFDPAALQQVQQLADTRAKLSEALKRNFDLAKSNPSQAQALLDKALQSTDPAAFIAALGGTLSA